MEFEWVKIEGNPHTAELYHCYIDDYTLAVSCDKDSPDRWDYGVFGCVERLSPMRYAPSKQEAMSLVAEWFRNYRELMS